MQEWVGTAGSRDGLGVDVMNREGLKVSLQLWDQWISVFNGSGEVGSGSGTVGCSVTTAPEGMALTLKLWDVA